jgi:hypothetical protein
MTEVGLMLVGINAPADPSQAAPMTMILSFEDAGDATSAMLQVERALHGERSPITGHPYTDRLKPIGMQIVGTGDGPAMLVLRARLVQGADDWLAIMRERDFGFMMWSPSADEE